MIDDDDFIIQHLIDDDDFIIQHLMMMTVDDDDL